MAAKSEVLLLICNVPKGFPVFELADEIDKKLCRTDVTNGIKKISIPDNEDTVNVEVIVNNEDANFLLHNPKLKVKHAEKIHTLLITKNRSSLFSMNKNKTDNAFSSTTTNDSDTSKACQQYAELSEEEENMGETMHPVLDESRNQDLACKLKAFEKRIPATNEDMINMIDLVKNSTTFSQRLSKDLKNIANFTIQTKQNMDIIIEFTPILSKLVPKSQVEFESVCEKLLKTFFSEFVSCNAVYSFQVWHSFKQKYGIKKEYTVWIIDEMSYECCLKCVQKEHTSICHTTIIGEKHVVADILCRLEELKKNIAAPVSKPRKNSSSSCRKRYDIFRLAKIPFSEEPYLWHELLAKEPLLFSKFQENCVVAQNIPEDSTYDDIRFYFENVSYSKVQHIIRIKDGILVAFDSPEGVSYLTAQNDLNFRGNKLFVFPKKVPKAMKKVLFIEGVKLSIGEVQEIFSKKTSKKFKVVQISRSGKFLVVFESSNVWNIDLDVRKIKDDFKYETTAAITEIKQICHPDCLLIENPNPLVSSDMVVHELLNHDVLITCFEKKNKAGLAYFSNYEDATRIYKNKSISVGQYPLLTQIFFPGVGKIEDNQYKSLYSDFEPTDHNPNSSTTSIFGEKSFSTYSDVLQDQNQFRCMYTVPHEALHLLTASKHLVDVVNDKLVGYVRVEWRKNTAKPPRLEVAFSPVKKKRETNPLTKYQFEEQCRNMVWNVLLEVITEPIYEQLWPAAIEKLKACYGTLDDATLVDKDDLQVYIKWNSKLGCTAFTGFKEHVEGLKAMLKERNYPYKCSKSDCKKLFESGNFAITQYLSLIDVSRSSDCNLNIRGTKSDIDDAIKAIEKYLNDLPTLQDTRVDGLTSTEQKFLSECSKKRKKEVENRINEQFRRENLNAYFELAGLRIKHEEDEFQRCQTILQGMIEQRLFQIPDGFQEAKYSEGWRKIQQFADDPRHCLKLKEKEGFLKLVGFHPEFSEAKHKVETFLIQSNDKEEVIQMETIKRNYILEFATAIGLSHIVKEIDLELQEDGIHLTGQRHITRKAASEIRKIAGKLTITSQVIEEAWQMKFFKSAAGEQFLKTLQDELTCLIVTEEKTGPVRKGSSSSLLYQESKDYNPTHYGNPSPLPYQTEPPYATQSSHQAQYNQPPMNYKMQYPEVRLAGSNVILKLVKNDITKHQVAAIVNASNDELELRAAGVSGSILRQGGSSIQQEMNDARMRLPTQRLEVGTAVTTNAGRLPCQKIVHVAGPVWYKLGSQAPYYLKQSVTACLREADKYSLSSIAIPAISCGVFGGKPDESARLILEAITEYFCHIKHASLKQVDLIELSNADVIRAFIKHLKQLDTDGKGTLLSCGNIHGGPPSPTGASQGSETYGYAGSQGAVTFGGGDAHGFEAARYQANAGAIHEPSRESRDQNRPSSFKVIVKIGDILNTRADVLLNTVGPKFEFDGTAISRLLLKQVDRNTVQSWNDRYRCQVFEDRFRIGNAGAFLPFKYIAHLRITYVSTKADFEKITVNILDIFKAVENLRQESIALSAMGTGKSGVKPENSASMIRSAIEKFRRTKPKYLKTILLIIYEERLLRFYNHLTVVSEQPRSVNPKQQHSFPSPRTSTSSFEQPAYVRKPEPVRKPDHERINMGLKFCSESRQLNNETYERVKSKLNSRKAVKHLKMPRDFDVNCLSEFMRRNKEVEIEMDQSNYEIILSGLYEDVMAVSKDLEPHLVASRADNYDTRF